MRSSYRKLRVQLLLRLPPLLKGQSYKNVRYVLAKSMVAFCQLWHNETRKEKEVLQVQRLYKFLVYSLLAAAALTLSIGYFSRISEPMQTSLLQIPGIFVADSKD